MRRRALLATLVLLALPAPAGAWVESAAYDVPDGDVAACLRAASPGHVSLLDLRGPATTDLLGAEPTGFTPGASTALGDRWRCGAIASAGAGAPLLAAWRHTGRRGPDVLRVATPGARAVAIRSVRGRFASDPVVALAPSGAAAIAWTEQALRGAADERLYVAVRPSATAPFGRPSLLGTVDGVPGRPAVGIDDAGRATVAWLQERTPRSSGGPLGYMVDNVLVVATATAGGRFRPPRRLARSLGGRVALAVLPDGRALLASSIGGGLGAYERLAAGGRFVPVRLTRAGSAHDLAVALAPDGGAVIAFRNDERSVFAALRAPGGDFRRWETVVPLARTHGDSLGVISDGGRGPDDQRGRGLGAALGANGEVALSWVDDARGHDMATAYAAHGTLARGLERPERLSGPCRSAAAAAPLTLADGRLAVAWSDDADVRRLTEDTLPLGGGRVHLARDATAGTTPAHMAPRLTARVVQRALEPGQALRVRVRCDGAACDARVLARARSAPRSGGELGGGNEAIWFAATTTLPDGGSALVSLPRFWGFNAAGVRGRPRTPIDVIACAPGGTVLDRVELTPPRIVELPPLPRILDLTAKRRAGGAIRVTWRTSAPAERARFTIVMLPGYRWFGRFIAGRGRSSFGVTLPPRRLPVRHVAVEIASPAASSGRSVSVPVT